jgi:hypothetical protein
MTPAAPSPDVGPSRPDAGTGSRTVLFVYTAVCAILYWPTLTKKFVFDDWLFLRDAWKDGAIGFLARSWNPEGGMLYRPLVKSLLLLSYQVFGLWTLPANVALFACHVLNGYLISAGSRRLGANPAGAGLAGLLYLCLAPLHIDPLLWFVGFFDVALVTFSLLAFIAFLDDKPVRMALMCLLALLTKEAGVFLLPLLLAWGLLLRRPWRQAAGLAVLFACYVAVKMQGISPFAQVPTHPHAMTLSPPHAFSLLLRYAEWIASSFAPLLVPAAAGILAIGFGFAVALYWIPNRRLVSAAVPSKDLVMLGAWMLLALGPVLLLRNQSARYYGVHAAVPLCILAGIALSETLGRIPLKRSAWILAIAGLPIFAGNLIFARQMYSQGIHQQITDDGWFHLIKRSAAVDSLYVEMFEKYPSVPQGSHVAITGLPLDAIGYGAAVQLWYRDSLLTVDVGMDSSSTSLSPEACPVHITVTLPRGH